MKEDIKRVLDLLEEGKISKEEALELIEALKESGKQEGDVDEKQDVSKRRLLRIYVEKDGKKAVNVTLPLSLINFGLKTFKATGKKSINIEGQEIPFDIDEINKAINDPDFRGKIIDIDEPDKNAHVEIEIT
jgi:hypothetical protein